MDYEVSLTETVSRPTAVVAAATSWQEFPALWGRLLGEVWGCLRAGINRAGGDQFPRCSGSVRVKVGKQIGIPAWQHYIAASLKACWPASTARKARNGLTGGALT